MFEPVLNGPPLPGIIIIMKYFAVSVVCTLLVAGCNSSVQNKTSLQNKTSVEMKASTQSTTARTRGSVEARALLGSLPVTNKSGVSEGSIDLEHGWVNVVDISLEHENGQEYTAVGPFAVNLLTGEAYPAIPALNIPVGELKAIEFELDLLEPELAVNVSSAGAPQEVTDWLATSSMYIKGVYANGTDNWPITFENDMSESFRLVGGPFTQNQLSINADGGTNVIIAFRADGWFDFTAGGSDVKDLANLVQNGGIVISNTDTDTGELTPTHDFIQSNIEDSTEYGEDL